MTITDQQIDAAFSAFVRSCNEMVKCGHCDGRGYLHADHEPDYCDMCGGSQYVQARDDRASMRLALEAALKVQANET